MSNKTFISNGFMMRSVAVMAIVALAGCDENGKFAFPGAGAGTTQTAAENSSGSSQSVQLVERDVEAPEAFQVTEAGLWDGRPSLGGVWVAHPDVRDPERVIIRNQANGNFVIGALFRRERENPGPSLQVSSDAAEALGMLAGAPAQLQVTALRREEAPQPAPEAQPTSNFDAPAAIAATPLDAAGTADPIGNAAAAIDAAEASAPPPAPRPTPPAAASSLSKPFIQIGIFSVEANATRAGERMRANGIVPTVLEQSSQGRTFWRVIAGPATSENERAQMLRQIKGLGFSDAYAVTN